MTWNVENLFRPKDGDDNSPDEATYRKKLDYLAGVIRSVGPDALAVQEIGGPQVGTDLASAVGEGWQAWLSEHPDPRGIRVGVLSPHQVRVETEVVDLPAAGLPDVPGVDGKPIHQMGRGALQVHVDVAGGL